MFSTGFYIGNCDKINLFMLKLFVYLDIGASIYNQIESMAKRSKPGQIFCLPTLKTWARQQPYGKHSLD